jgi:hypothetical protein
MDIDPLPTNNILIKRHYVARILKLNTKTELIFEGQLKRKRSS